MKSLRKGIGNKKDIEKYYDNWSSSYDETLYKWKYKAPLQSVKILKKYIKTKPKFILDLACGSGPLLKILVDRNKNFNLKHDL